MPGVRSLVCAIEGEGLNFKACLYWDSTSVLPVCSPSFSGPLDHLLCKLICFRLSALLVPALDSQSLPTEASGSILHQLLLIAPMTEWLRWELVVSLPRDESIDLQGEWCSLPPGKWQFLPPSSFALSFCSCRQHATKTNIILKECSVACHITLAASGAGPRPVQWLSSLSISITWQTCSTTDCLPHPQFAVQYAWREAGKSAFLPSPQ